MRHGLMVVAPNVSLTPGKWMGSNFILSLLSTAPFNGEDTDVYVVSRGAKGSYRRWRNVHLLTVASSFTVEPFDRYGLWWSGQYRISRAQAVGRLLRDSIKVSLTAARVVPRVQHALWWTEHLMPFGKLLQGYERLRGVTSSFTLANYRPSLPQYKRLLRGVLSGFDHVVAPCNALHSRLAEAGLPASRLRTIPLGTDLERFKPLGRAHRAAVRSSYGLPEEAPVAMWAGPIIPPSRVQDVHALLDAVPSVRSASPDAWFLFAFKYGVPPGLTAPDPHVLMLGAYGPFHELLASADLLALPFSDPGEWVTTPLSIIEAQSCGVPVVTVRRPGLDELVEDGVTGLLVDSPEAFPSALSYLLSDRPLRERMGRQARERAMACFDIRSTARRYADLILGD